MNDMTRKKSTAIVAATATPTAPDERKMEQVRDLLFGSLARDYDRRLQELSERLTLESTRVGHEMERRFTALESRLESALERLGSQLKQEAAARVAAVDDLDIRLTQALRTQRSEFGESVEGLGAQLIRVEVQSREAVAALQSELMASLHALREATMGDRDKLREDKVGRADLADLMGELSLRLRGTLELPDLD